MKNKKNNQMGYGALISYLLIIGNALFGLLITPYILTYLGTSAFGVYKAIGALSVTLLVLDLGIGGTLTRYIAKYRANAEEKKIGCFVSLMICECSILIPIIVLVEVVLYNQIDWMYSTSFTYEELELAKQLFIILSVNVVLNIIEHFMNGIISGYNDFIFGKGIKLAILILRILLILVLLPVTKSAVFVVSINLGLIVIVIIVQLIYIIKNYQIHLSFKRKNWEYGIFKESFFYTFLIFLTTIAAQVNSNIDNVIVGAFCGTSAVTIYSFGLLIFGMFQELSTAISGVALPTVSELIARDNWNEKVQDFVVKSGRIQFMLLGAATIGFIVLGKDFIDLWLGSGYEDVYWIVIILIIPALFELCVNICLAVLRVNNMLGFRTIVLIASTVLNLIVSIVGIKYLGYFAAAVGTAISFLVGSLIVMNIYYNKKLQFNMYKIYKRILQRTIMCLIVAGIIIKGTSHFLNGTWFYFCINIVVFFIVYAIMMFAWGFSDEERRIANGIRKKIIKRGKMND